MPSSFHTKTIEQILDPVAQQVSELVVLHEKGEDGAAMPNLQNQIKAVNSAVTNLALVGNQQVETSRDEVLKLDTPPALQKLTASSHLLVESTEVLTADPYSKDGREKLISGARGILQGTSDVLLIFDEAEVRRICLACQNVRDYLSVSEVVQGMPDMVTYVKSLTPGMTNMTKMVSQRASDLTNQLHADKLEECIKSLREQLPNFLSSIKLIVSTFEEGGKALEAASSNRLYYVSNLAAVITEMIRYLQMVSSDQEVQCDPMNLDQLNQSKEVLDKNIESGKKWVNNSTASPDSIDKLALMEALDSARDIATAAGDEILASNVNDIAKKVEKLAQLRKEGKGNSPEAKRLQAEIAQSLDRLSNDVDRALDQLNSVGQSYDVITKEMPIAKEWLANPNAKPGADTGSEGISKMVKAARGLAKSLPADRITNKERAELMNLCNEIDGMMEQLNVYRERGEGQKPEARALSKQIADKLNQMNTKIAKILTKNSIPQTLEGKMDKAKRWLDNPGDDDEGQGLISTHKIIAEARKLAHDVQDPKSREELIEKATNCEKKCNELDEMIKRGLGGTSKAKELAEDLKEDLKVLQTAMKKAMVGLVADEFADSSLALKQLNAAALVSKSTPNREEVFDEKADIFEKQANKLTKLGKQAVAQSSFGAEKKLKEVDQTTKKINDLTKQVVTAGRIVLQQPENDLAKQHFKALQDEWSENMDRLTEQVDNAVDVAEFLKCSEKGIYKEKEKCDEAMDANDILTALNSAGNMAKRAERIVVAGKREMDNTDDPVYVSNLKTNLMKLNGTIPQMVNATRGYVQSRGADPQAKEAVKKRTDDLVHAVSDIRTTVEARLIEEQMMNLPPPPPPPPVEDEPLPPLPPAPSDSSLPSRPPVPEEEDFPEVEVAEGAEREETMMKAAKELHDEAKQWESQGNSIIIAAKRMACLMAKMSSLVGSGTGKKSELISCAKEIAKASAEVTKLANEVANKCTDKRIRVDMIKTLERIPTVSTQLRILSTVKAASLGDSTDLSKDDEDAAQQATELLVHNAQNLMMAVKDTVKYAEAASIRIRTDAGVKIRWIRRTS